MYKQKMSNLNKQNFLSFGVLRFILGSSLVLPWSLTMDRLGKYNRRDLKKSTF